MNKEQKTAVVDQVAEQISESQAIFAIDYRGMTVAQAAELRTKLREADATLRVVKNTLTERAADKAGAESLKAHLDGPTAFTFVRGDAALAAKALAAFRKEHELLEFKGGTLDGAELSVDDILAISKLPSREALHGQLVGVLAYPIGGLARTLNQLIQGLAVQLGQIAEQGLVGGGAEEPAAEEAPAASEEAPAAEEEPATEEEPAAEEAPAAEAASEDEVPEAGEEAAGEGSDEPAGEDTSEEAAASDDASETSDETASEAPSEGDEAKED